MIKGDYFGKLLKQSFFTLLIGFFTFGLGCFASAGYLKQIGTYSSNPYISSFDINFSKSGNPLTMNLGYTKQMFVLYQNSSSFCGWFWNAGLPYIYCYGLGSSLYQGNITEYEVCRELVSSDYNKPGGCVITTVGESSVEVVKSFLSSLTNDDYFLFNMTYGGSTNFYSNAFCFSNHSLGKSFCFNFTPNNTFNNTLNLNGNLNFDSFPSSYLQNPPSSSSGGGSSGGGTNVSYSGNTVSYKCTYDIVLQYAEGLGYNRNLCYGGLDNFDDYNPNTTYNPIPGTGKTLGQIVSHSSNTWGNFDDWFYFWNGLYGGYEDMWSSYPAVYKTWFDMYYRFGGQGLVPQAIYEYCIIINMDIDYENTLYNNPYNKVFGNVCNHIQTSTDISNLNVSGNVILGVNWSGFFDGTGNNLSGENVNSAVGYIQDFFNLIKTNLGSVNGSSGPGVLPLYIITFMCGLILFRFISH